jgi:hypothetical protein
VSTFDPTHSCRPTDAALAALPWPECDNPKGTTSLLEGWITSIWSHTLDQEHLEPHAGLTRIAGDLAPGLGGRDRGSGRGATGGLRGTANAAAGHGARRRHDPSHRTPDNHDQAAAGGAGRQEDQMTTTLCHAETRGRLTRQQIVEPHDIQGITAA